jgi:hypothetical protein
VRDWRERLHRVVAHQDAAGEGLRREDYGEAPRGQGEQLPPGGPGEAGPLGGLPCRPRRGKQLRRGRRWMRLRLPARRTGSLPMKSMGGLSLSIPQVRTGVNALPTISLPVAGPRRSRTDQTESWTS